MTDQGNASLEYVPDWYHVGDPDQPMFAILYGVVAILTIRVIEDITQRVFFPKSFPITLANFAAQVTFSSASWYEIVWWLVHRPPRALVCTRAVIGAIARFLVFAAEVIIIIMAIPRKLNVMETNTGSSQLVFGSPGANSLLANSTFFGVFSQPCVRDKTLYEGFSSTARRQVCVLRRTYTDRFSSGALGDAMRESGSLTFSFQKTSTESLLFSASGSDTLYEITHTLTTEEDPIEGFHPSLRFRLVRLPLPENIVQQAISQILIDEKLRSRCSQSEYQRNIGGIQSVTCRGLRDEEILPERLFLSSGTIKVQATRDKYAGRGQHYGVVPVVGTANRPYLCIFPAVVLLSSLQLALFLVRVIQWFFQVDGNIALWTWQYFCKRNGLQHTNPLCSESHDIGPR